MSVEELEIHHLSQATEDKQVPFSIRLQQTLASCSKSIEAGDFIQSEKSISDLVDFLGSISDSVASEPDNEDSENTAFEVLSEIHRYISSPSLDQAVMDSLSFELPKAVARFAGASNRCLEIAESIIDRFIVTCSPRDMLSILCEALGSPGKMFKTPSYFAPFLSGLAKVFDSIQRRHFEQVKAAIPVILNVLKVISLESDDEDIDSEDLFNRAIGVANSIQAVCVKLEGKDKEKLCALFGLFTLQIMALASISMGHEVSSCLPLVLQLSHLLHYCGLSYLGLITGSDVDMITSIVIGEDGDDYMNCFSYVKHGAAVAVIWGHMLDEVAVATGANLAAVKDELQSSQTKRWEAVGMLKYIFSCINLPWQLKKDAIDFLRSILEGDVSRKSRDEHIDYSLHMPSLYAALQAVQMVIIYAADSVLRKNAFDAFKRVLADVPTSPRFDILVALIKNSESSSMIAILLGCVKDEMLMEIRLRVSVGNGVLQPHNRDSQNALFWSPGVLELVELVLRPSRGGPPSLPEYSDAVLSALNLYRFVLITESTGKTNYTGVLSKDHLQKAYDEWLLPLRTLVSGIVAETQKDCDHVAFDAVCALNPLELVLYRCIELVEENLKRCA